MFYRTEDIDKLVWQDYLDLHALWAKHPPVDIMVAAYLGYKPKVIDKTADQTFALDELCSMFPVTIVKKGEANGG